MPIWGMHFAGCEIKNDTKVDMYIARKVDWAIVATTVTTIGGIIAAIGTYGGSLAALGATVVADVGVEAMTGAAFIGGFFLKQGFWTIVGNVGKGTKFVGNVLGKVLNLTPQASDKLKHDLALAPEGTDVIVHTDKSIMEIVEGNSDKDLAAAMNMTESQVRDMKKVIKDHKHGAKRIPPGKSFKFDTGCYSTWKVHVITENLEERVESVWTSFWYGQYSHYKASKLFTHPKKISSTKLPIKIHKKAA